MSAAEAALLPRLLISLCLGALLGVERELTEHPAGIRTLGLVSMGSCLFSLVGLAQGGPGVDPTRVAAQVVTGIGFLGAGVILHIQADVRGLTTAASIWIAAAIGMAVAFGYFYLALAATVLTILALPAKIVAQRLQRAMGRRGRPPGGGVSELGAGRTGE